MTLDPSARRSITSLVTGFSGSIPTPGDENYKIRQAFGWNVTQLSALTGLVTCTLSGTLVDGVEEAALRAGGETLIFTLTNDTWVSGSAFKIFDSGLLNSLNSDQSEPNGWDATMDFNWGANDLVRTSDTVATLTTPPFPNYNISIAETISATITHQMLVNTTANFLADNTFTISTSVEFNYPAGFVYRRRRRLRASKIVVS